MGGTIETGGDLRKFVADMKETADSLAEAVDLVQTIVEDQIREDEVLRGGPRPMSARMPHIRGGCTI